MNKTTSLFLMMFTMFAGVVSSQNPQTEELTKLYNSMEFEKTIVKAREFLKDDPQNIEYNAFLGGALDNNMEIRTFWRIFLKIMGFG